MNTCIWCNGTGLIGGHLPSRCDHAPPLSDRVTKLRAWAVARIEQCDTLAPDHSFAGLVNAGAVSLERRILEAVIGMLDGTEQ
jgi:hypothetical protein